MKFSMLLLATAFVSGAQGAAYCPCLQAVGMMFKPCNETFNISGTCSVADKKPGQPLLAPDYGASCKVHEEPFQADCTDQSDGSKMAPTDKNKWCWEPFCYVDPCTCDQPDMYVGAASYFTKVTKMAYSYGNCDGVDHWSEADAAKDMTYTKARPTDCHQSCSMVKDFYKKMECCGMPSKKIPYPMNYPYRNNIPYPEKYSKDKGSDSK